MQANGWYIVGTPFSPLNAEAQTYTIDELFSGTPFGEGDLLYVVDSTGAFSPRYWFESGENTGWSKSRRFWQEDTTEYSITSGVYLHPANDRVITFSGKVALIEVQVGDETGNKWDLTSLAYPVSSPLNEYTWEGFESGDTLYRLNSADGSFSPRYWYDRGDNTGWSKSNRFWQEDSEPLSIGHAVYIQKKSPGIGIIIKK